MWKTHLFGVQKAVINTSVWSVESCDKPETISLLLVVGIIVNHNLLELECSLKKCA